MWVICNLSVLLPQWLHLPGSTYFYYTVIVIANRKSRRSKISQILLFILIVVEFLHELVNSKFEHAYCLCEHAFALFIRVN